MSGRHGWFRLTIICLTGAGVWLIVLPWLARHEVVRERIERNRAAGIDPSAMFYTDLEHLTYRHGMLRREQPALYQTSSGKQRE